MSSYEQCKNRIAEVLTEKYGRQEEELLRSGLLDSVRAVQLAMQLAKEFNIHLSKITMSDMTSMTKLAQRISHESSAEALAISE